MTTTRASRAASSMPSSWSKSQLRACCASSRRCSRLASRVTTFCKAAHLLVEIGAQPAELLLVAQLVGLDDLVEAGGEGLVVGLRRELPVAPPGRGEGALADLVAGAAPAPRRPPSGRSRARRPSRPRPPRRASPCRRRPGELSSPCSAVSSSPPSSPSSSSPPSSGSSSDGSSAAARSRSSSSRRDSLAKAAWSSSVSASASSSAAGLLLDPRRDQLRARPARPWAAPRRSAARGRQPDRGRQRHFLGGAGADDRVARARALRPDGRDWRARRPSPARRAPRPAPFRARRTPRARRGRPAAVRGVELRHRDGAAEARPNPRRRAPRRPAAARAPARAKARARSCPTVGRGLGREHHVDLGILGDRPRRAGERAAEEVDALGHWRRPSWPSRPRFPAGPCRTPADNIRRSAAARSRRTC